MSELRGFESQIEAQKQALVEEQQIANERLAGTLKAEEERSRLFDLAADAVGLLRTAGFMPDLLLQKTEHRYERKRGLFAVGVKDIVSVNRLASGWVVKERYDYYNDDSETDCLVGELLSEDAKIYHFSIYGRAGPLGNKLSANETFTTEAMEFREDGGPFMLAGAYVDIQDSIIQYLLKRNLIT